MPNVRSFSATNLKYITYIYELDADIVIHPPVVDDSPLAQQNLLFHLLPLPFHILHQCDLRSGAVKIVSRAGGVEIDVAFEIIGKEAHAAFQCHDLCPFRKRLDFKGGKFSVCTGQKAFYIGGIEGERERDPG